MLSTITLGYFSSILPTFAPLDHYELWMTMILSPFSRTRSSALTTTGENGDAVLDSIFTHEHRLSRSNTNILATNLGLSVYPPGTLVVSVLQPAQVDVYADKAFGFGLKA
jgi:hypothetical protein